MNIYVGNLSRTTTEDGLKKMFEQYGEVQSVKIMKDKFTGEVRGFGFVTFEDYACVDACLEAQKREPLMMRGKKVQSLFLEFIELLFTHALATLFFFLFHWFRLK